VLAKKLPVKYSFISPAGQLADVLGQVMLVVAPGEVGVGLGESHLRQQAHHLWLGEGFGEEDDFRVLPVHFADHPFPERHRLGMRVVDAEGGDALVDPEQEDLEHLLPQPARSLVPKLSG
jgi:hypothetical protein